jgi:hypothetical protein
MWTDAIELGIIAFLAHDEADDDVIQNWLEALGVQPWLATRLVTWLPIAFGRKLLHGARFPDVYDHAGGSSRLGDDPIYVAATQRAARMTREEADAIAFRSAEVNAVNAWLQHESAHGRERRIEEMDASALALGAPLPDVQPGDGGVPEPRATFAELLRSHGHEIAPGPGTRLRAGALEVDALVYGRVDERSRYRVQVDFLASHPRLARGTLLESFAGLGETYRDVVHDATRKFERGSLHVLIATLLERGSCADQVEWERWPGGWEVCMGPQLVLYAQVGPVPLGELLDGLRDAFAREVHDRAVHAIRIFTMRNADLSYADEVLLDGETWPAGEALCRAHAWPRFECVWGTRLFLMVAPDASQP